MGICFVIQPFDDGGEFDRRYQDVFEPAIRDSDLDPYRVDRDPYARIPYQKIEEKIKTAEACLADITKDNPNVWFEIGFALALKKQIVFVCNQERYDKDGNFPFDVQHYSIIKYQTGSPSDFDELKLKITESIKAAKEKYEDVKTPQDFSALAEKEGFTPHEITALAIILGESITNPEGISGYFLHQQMELYGFNKVASSVSIKSLLKKGFVQTGEQSDINETYTVYSLTPKGEQWALENQNEFNMKYEHQMPPDDDFDNGPF